MARNAGKNRLGIRRSTVESPQAEDIRATDSELLNQTQAYLGVVLCSLAPDSLLVEAWEDFYRIYSELIRRFALAQGVSPSDVDDCVQQVWQDVTVSLPDFKYAPERHGLRSWLFKIVRSKATDMLRRQRRRASDSLDQVPPKLSVSDSDPVADVEKRWQAELIQTVLAELRAKESATNYQVLYLRKIEERSTEEVAASLGLTTEQVWYRQHRMLRKFRTIFNVFAGNAFDADS